jgi:hypothetical protein
MMPPMASLDTAPQAYPLPPTRFEAREQRPSRPQVFRQALIAVPTSGTGCAVITISPTREVFLYRSSAM